MYNEKVNTDETSPFGRNDWRGSLKSVRFFKLLVNQP
jgi:hypothetical protein